MEKFGSGMEKFGSGITIPDPQHGVQFSAVKYIKEENDALTCLPPRPGPARSAWPLGRAGGRSPHHRQNTSRTAFPPADRTPNHTRKRWREKSFRIVYCMDTQQHKEQVLRIRSDRHHVTGSESKTGSNHITFSSAIQW